MREYKPGDKVKILKAKATDPYHVGDTVEIVKRVPNALHQSRSNLWHIDIGHGLCPHNWSISEDDFTLVENGETPMNNPLDNDAFLYLLDDLKDLRDEFKHQYETHATDKPITAISVFSVDRGQLEVVRRCMLKAQALIDKHDKKCGE